VTSLAFAPDGKALASAASDGVRVWDLTTGDTRLMLETAPEVESLAFMPDGRALVALTTSTVSTLEPAEAVAWDLAAGSERSRVPTPGKRTPLTVSPDARYALWATTSDASDAARCTPTLHVWDLARPRPLQVTGLPGRDGVAVGVDVTPDGREAIVLSQYRWWRVELGTLRRIAQGPVTYRGRLLDLGVGLWRLGQLIAVASGLLAPPEPEPEEPVFERSDQQGFDQPHLGADLTFKLAGFSLAVEWLWRRANESSHMVTVSGASVTEYARSGYGYHVQAGYLFNDHLEVSARWAQVIPFRGSDPRLHRTRELGAGASWYFAQHNLKIQADWFNVFREEFADGQHQARAQLQVYF